MNPHKTETNKMSLTIELRPSKLDKIVLRETIDNKYLKALKKYKKQFLSIPEKFGDSDFVYDEEKMIDKYNKLLSKNKYQYVEMEWARRKVPYGRVFAKHNGSIMCFCYKLRNTLCFNKYHDIDIDNCHPSILNQICELNGYAHTELNKYCVNRKQYLKDLMDTCKIERFAAKCLFISLMLGSSINSWKKKFGVKTTLPKSILDFEKELKTIRDNIAERNPILKKTITTARLKTDPFYDKSRTWQGNVLSYFLCYYEEMLLECIFDYLVENRYIQNNECVLAFDGLMIRRQAGLKNMNTLFKGIENYVYEKTGFVIKMSEKSMDNNYIKELDKLLEDESRNEDNDTKNIKEKVADLKKLFLGEFPFEDLSIFNERFFDYLSLDRASKDMNMTTDYYLKRQYFCENNVMLSETKSFLIKRRSPENNSIYWERQANLNIQHLKFQKFADEEKEELSTLPFEMMVYKDDRTFPRYNYDTFKPMGINEKSKKDNFYNTFSGFEYRDMDVDPTKEDFDLLYDYLNYMFVYICSSNFDIFTYYLSHLREIILNPRSKNGIGVLFYSKDKGVGKNEHCSFLKRVFGEYLCLSTKMNALFERFSEIDDYLVVFFEEISSTILSNNENYSTLKTKITEVSSRRDIKFRDPRKSYSFSRFFFLTNELNSFKVDSDERRMFFLNFLKEYDTKKANEIYALLKEVNNSKVVPRLFGLFLEKFELYSYGNQSEWNNAKPKTGVDELFKNENPVENFLTDMCMNTLKLRQYPSPILSIDKDITFSLNNLYELFKLCMFEDNITKRSFKKTTFKKNVLNIFNNMKSKRDSKLKENVLIVDFEYFTERLKNLKLLEKDVENTDIMKALDEHNRTQIADKDIQKMALNKLILHKQRQKALRIINIENKKQLKSFDKEVKECLNEIKTSYKMTYDRDDVLEL